MTPPTIPLVQDSRQQALPIAPKAAGLFYKIHLAVPSLACKVCSKATGRNRANG